MRPFTLPLCFLFLSLSGCSSIISNSSTRAYEYCHAKNYAAAVSEYQKALSEDPRSECLLTNFILCSVKGRYFQAPTTAVAALEGLPPTTAFAWRTLGEYYYKTSRYAKALPAFRAATFLDAAGRDYYYIARTMEHLNLDPRHDWLLAKHYYEIDSKGKEPDRDAAFWSDYGYVLEQVGDCEMAKMIYQKVLILDPTNDRASKKVNKTCR